MREALVSNLVQGVRKRQDPGDMGEVGLEVVFPSPSLKGQPSSLPHLLPLPKYMERSFILWDGGTQNKRREKKQ